VFGVVNDFVGRCWGPWDQPMASQVILGSPPFLSIYTHRLSTGGLERNNKAQVKLRFALHRVVIHIFRWNPTLVDTAVCGVLPGGVRLGIVGWAKYPLLQRDLSFCR